MIAFLSTELHKATLSMTPDQLNSLEYETEMDDKRRFSADATAFQKPTVKNPVRRAKSSTENRYKLPHNYKSSVSTLPPLLHSSVTSRKFSPFSKDSLSL